MDMVIGMKTMMTMTIIMMMTMTRTVMMMVMTMMMMMMMIMIVTRMLMEMSRCKAWQEREAEQVQGQHLLPSQSYTGLHRHHNCPRITQQNLGGKNRQRKDNFHLYCQKWVQNGEEKKKIVYATYS